MNQRKIKRKLCTECGLSKPLSEFYDNPSGKHGKTAKCKSCLNKYNRTHSAKKREDPGYKPNTVNPYHTNNFLMDAF